MPLTLTTPLVTTIASYTIKQIEINLETNSHNITLACLDSNGTEVHRITLALPIFDSFGTVIAPSAWPDSNPTAEQMYTLVKTFMFMCLQDQRGSNGVGAGVIT
jgi:hypothetical protein